MHILDVVDYRAQHIARLLVAGVFSDDAMHRQIGLAALLLAQENATAGYLYHSMHSHGTIWQTTEGGLTLIVVGIVPAEFEPEGPLYA